MCYAGLVQRNAIFLYLIKEADMKHWVYILLLFAYSTSAQSGFKSGQAFILLNALASGELQNSVEVLPDALEIDAKAGDEVIVWTNSGVVIFRHHFQESSRLFLPMTFQIQGQYHLGYKKPGLPGAVTSFQMKISDAPGVDLAHKGR